MLLAFQRWNTSAPHQNPEKILLLHGMGGTGNLWRPIASSLENQFDVLAVDQRSHGRSRPVSDTATDFSPLALAQDVVETLEKLEFYPTWVIGHSMGMRTACGVAWLRPDWTHGVIGIDLGFAGAAGGGLGDRLSNFLSILPMRFASREQARAFMNEKCPDPSMGQYLMAVASVSADGSLTFPFDKEGILQILDAARESSVREWLRELGKKGMPILALRGERSTVWSKEEYTQEMRRFADIASVEFQEVPGTGHGLPFENRLEFIRRVTDFIRRTGAY